jgi:hypothetical protein
MTKEQIAAKDILHLYLGCDVQHRDGWIGTLRGVIREDRPSYQPLQIEAPNGKLVYWDYKDILPVFRPLSSMTEEEGKELIGLIYQSIFQDTPAIATIEKLTEDDKVGFIAFEKELNLRLSVTVEVDRGVEFYENGSQMKVRQFDITRWLFSKHFDIFNLIPSNLAKDATTINNQTESK